MRLTGSKLALCATGVALVSGCGSSRPAVSSAPAPPRSLPIITLAGKEGLTARMSASTNRPHIGSPFSLQVTVSSKGKPVNGTIRLVYIHHGHVKARGPVHRLLAGYFRETFRWPYVAGNPNELWVFSHIPSHGHVGLAFFVKVS